jgi:hypothetical protein
MWYVREVAKGMMHSKAYQPVFLISTNFFTATLVLKFQLFGQDSSLKHFLLFEQAISQPLLSHVVAI